MSTASIHQFHGRTAELAQLRRLFEECATRDPATGRFGGPRMAFVIAESGIGKSRLVQALYQQLTTDPLWNPPEINYWPDAFMDTGVELRVTPNMARHVAHGPPRFAWIGARIHGTDTRNFGQRWSSLAELRHSIMTHAMILRAHGSAWTDATGRIKHAIARYRAGETFRQRVDAAVPFGGLLSKLVTGGRKFVRGQPASPKSVKKARDALPKNIVDDVEECMHSLLDGSDGLPSILWLDDAHWIEAETQELLQRVWRIACECDWPLFIVVTHAKCSWREFHRQPDGERGLVFFEGQPGVSIIDLQDAEPDALRSYLQLHLPGLPPDQQLLMIEKAAGNFLTMVENVGLLLCLPEYFVDRRTTDALCSAGERAVREWQGDCHKRAGQRFTKLASAVQNLLGWCSDEGMSFLHGVVEEFAEQVADKPRAAITSQERLDPLAIRERPNPLLSEFRDRAFHAAAKHHFGNYGQEQAARLEEILGEHLAEWVNNCFDDSGEEIDHQCDHNAGDLPEEERRDLLGMAVNAFRPSATDGWGEFRSIVWIRALYLLTRFDWEEELVDRVQQHCNELVNARVDWNVVPPTALTHSGRRSLAFLAEASGAFGCALAVLRAEIQFASGLVVELTRTPSRGDAWDLLYEIDSVTKMLYEVAGNAHSRGDLDGALTFYEGGLQIRRGCMAVYGTPESGHQMSISLHRLADIKLMRGDLESALSHCDESLALHLRWVADSDILFWTRTLKQVVMVAHLGAGIEVSLFLAEAALLRLDSVLEKVYTLELIIDPDAFNTAATYWDLRADALDAVGWISEAAESRDRALVLRIRIVDMGGE